MGKDTIYWQVGVWLPVHLYDFVTKQVEERRYDYIHYLVKADQSFFTYHANTIAVAGPHPEEIREACERLRVCDTKEKKYFHTVVRLPGHLHSYITNRIEQYGFEYLVGLIQSDYFKCESIRKYEFLRDLQERSRNGKAG